jgi:hypothetical protein
MITQTVSIRTWTRSMGLHSKTHKTLLSHPQTTGWPIILPSKRVNICLITNHLCIHFPLWLNISAVSPQLTNFHISFSLAREIKTSMTQPWVSKRRLTIQAATEWSLVEDLVMVGTLSIWMPTPLSIKTSLLCLIPRKVLGRAIYTSQERENIGCIPSGRPRLLCLPLC